MLASFAYRRSMHTDTAEEDALIAELGGRRVTCSPRGLLTSHCIVLCHHALDTVGEARAAARARAEGHDRTARGRFGK